MSNMLKQKPNSNLKNLSSVLALTKFQIHKYRYRCVYLPHSQQTQHNISHKERTKRHKKRTKLNEKKMQTKNKWFVMAEIYFNFWVHIKQPYVSDSDSEQDTIHIIIHVWLYLYRIYGHKIRFILWDYMHTKLMWWPDKNVFSVRKKNRWETHML